MAPLWLDVLDETIQVCAAYRRADLAGRLQERRGQLLDPTLRVLVVGAPKQGKSQLVNAIVNAPVCAVGDGANTAVPALVEPAGQAGLVLIDTPPLTATGWLPTWCAQADAILVVSDATRELDAG